jgi:hypothetical protein
MKSQKVKIKNQKVEQLSLVDVSTCRNKKRQTIKPALLT